jgi:3-hydroxyacyl-[acyl-carrier-protein] dehydratase
MEAIDNEIFIINKLEHTDGSVKAELVVNQQSSILKGHFPGQPVVPGACMLQLIKDILESALSISLLLKKADHLKFISMIIPKDNQPVLLNLSYKTGESISVTGKLVIGEVVCFKFQGNFVEV